jgi:hypothetical protein
MSTTVLYVQQGNLPIPLSEGDIVHFDDESYFFIDFVQGSGDVRVKRESDDYTRVFSSNEFSNMFEESDEVFIDYA